MSKDGVVRGARGGVGHQAVVLGGFTLVAAALLVAGHLATRAAIEQRHTEDLLASLAQVLPAEIYSNDLTADPVVVEVADGESVTVYRAIDEDRVGGVAFRVAGQGYGGRIRILLGVDARGGVLGVRVVGHAETPGLGDKIEIERDDWILGFDGRSLGDPPADRWTVEKDGGVFDQFTGATITPRAVVIAVRRGLEFFAAHQARLLAPPAPLPARAAPAVLSGDPP